MPYDHRGTRRRGIAGWDGALARAVAAVDHDCEVRERRGDGDADAHEQDGAGGGLAVGREVKADEREDAERVDGGDELCDRAAVLDHGGPDRDGGRGEEQQQHDGGGALDCAVEPEAGGKHDCALGGAQGEGGLEDLVDGALGAAHGDHGEVEGEGLEVVAEFVVDDGFWELVVPRRVGGEGAVVALREGDPQPAAEGRGEGEGHDAEHVVDLRLPDVDGGGVRRSGRDGVRVACAAHAEVDEHDRGRPVEVREALVPEVDHVERDGHEHAVEGDGAARDVRVRAAHALAVEEGAAAVAGAAAERGREGQDLEDLPAKAHCEQQREDQDHVRVVELELHAMCTDVFNKASRRYSNCSVAVLKSTDIESLGHKHVHRYKLYE